MYSDAYVDPDTKKIYRTQVVNVDVCGWDFVHSFFFFLLLLFCVCLFYERPCCIL